MFSDKKLKELMGKSDIPPASRNLADRIIMAASLIEQKQNLWVLTGKIFKEFKLPSPAYSFASLLLVGFLAGFIIHGTPQIYASDDILYEDEELL